MIIKGLYTVILNSIQDPCFEMLAMLAPQHEVLFAPSS